MAIINEKYEFAGKGCAIQGIGLILLFFFPIGTLAGFGLLIWGSMQSKTFRCGNCGNRIESKQVKMCPTCKAEF